VPKESKRPTGICPKCGKKMEKRRIKVTRKKSPEQEIPDTVYVCTKGCRGVFIPDSIFGVHGE
jgi:hypothetical protein